MIAAVRCLSAGLFAALALAIASEPASGAYPGSDGKIAFSCFTKKTAGLCEVNSDGSHLTIAQGLFGFPAWSPDGRRIAYSAGRNGDDLRVINSNGTGDHSVIKRPSVFLGQSGQHPSWSPNGREIAFMTVVGGTPEIDVVTLAGDRVRQLTHGPAPVGAPAWSPDGSMIAFLRDSHVGQDICVMRPDGADVKCLTDARGCGDGLPDWSPDGTRIVFWSDCAARGSKCHGASGGPCEDIYVMNADGSHERRLTHDPVTADAPAWSPDGTKIVFVSKRTGNYQLFVMNADGTRQHQLTDGPGLFAVQPSWQPLNSP